MKSFVGTVRSVTLVGVAVAAALSFAASRAWSDGGEAQSQAAAACPQVGCVASGDGSFCMCRSGVDVCSGEIGVGACAARFETGTCCLSAGTCYCTREAACAEGDLPTETCDAKMIARGPRCEVGPRNP